MSLPTINAAVARLVADPEVRTTPSGTVVCNFRIVSNSRRQNDQGEWEDNKACWLSCVAWGPLAERIAASFHKADEVIVSGTLETVEWTTREGDKRSDHRLTVETIGASVRFADVKVTRKAAVKAS